MKIRWTNHSLRLRITPSELEALERDEVVRAELVLPGGGLPGGGWRAAVCPGEATSIEMIEGEVRLFLSRADRDQLARPDQEGVYFQTSSPPALRYFIEKDFPCVHPRAAEILEPPGETFAAPPGFEQRKTS